MDLGTFVIMFAGFGAGLGLLVLGVDRYRKYRKAQSEAKLDAINKETDEWIRKYVRRNK